MFRTPRRTQPWTPTLTNRAPSPRTPNRTVPPPTLTSDNQEAAASSTPDGDGSGEVLAILRSLQQQVSVLQAQQAAHGSEGNSNTSPQRETTANKETPRQKLPKELVSMVHDAVKHLKTRLSDPLEWNTSIGFTDDNNVKVTGEVVTALSNENYAPRLVRKAARTYFLTLKRRSRQISTGRLQSSQKAQRKIQRKHNKLHKRRSACAVSTSLTTEEKTRWSKILTMEFMSSEDSGSESGSGTEMGTRRQVFIQHPLMWRSSEANRAIESLDRKTSRRRSDRAKEMCRCRRSGEPSTRSPPSAAPAWAVVDGEHSDA